MEIIINGVEVINSNIKKDNSYVVFGTSLKNFVTITELASQENYLLINIVGAEGEVLEGFIYSGDFKTSQSEDREPNFKFRINFGEIEKIKVAELATLSGEIIDLRIELGSKTIKKIKGIGKEEDKMISEKQDEFIENKFYNDED